eukprot:CAMPEP_0119554674 /NCGR_PEP_ID=MMETSP1352-20130426/7083_1 /TAXON_ID=265584 /ORGANISM="Stauroneis constricta, Strain CCMP1120" /LENGTH=450 /DNA_ID=CAMNT_0007601289 /DNA_START=172 /DNA_END=1524 /DNA_ORIENTATION=+
MATSFACGCGKGVDPKIAKDENDVGNVELEDSKNVSSSSSSRAAAAAAAAAAASPPKSPPLSTRSRRNSKRRKSIPLNVQPNMNSTTNILVHFQLADLSGRSKTNLYLALVCLVVCAINMVLLLLNYLMHHPPFFGDASSSKRPDVSHRTFHMIEFWTVFVYSIADAGALVTSPKTMLNIYSKPLVLKLLLFCNIVASLVPAVLITLDTDYFERLAHELEYINEFTLSFIMLILLTSLLRQPEQVDNVSYGGEDDVGSSNNDGGVASSTNTTTTSYDPSSIIMGASACATAVTTFAVYNFSKEEYAHYWEFAFNILTSLVTFWFCMDNRFVAEMEIGQILYGQHKNCNLCQTHVMDYQVTRQTSIRWMSLYGAVGSGGNVSTNDNNNTSYYGTTTIPESPTFSATTTSRGTFSTGGCRSSPPPPPSTTRIIQGDEEMPLLSIPPIRKLES